MPNNGARVVAYKLGIGYPTTREGTPLYSWPYSVDFVPGYPNGDFYLSEGDTRNGNGIFLHAQQVLDHTWHTHLATAGVLWLVPLLERMVGGEAVAPSEILDVYRKLHGGMPPSESWFVGR